MPPLKSAFLSYLNSRSGNKIKIEHLLVDFLELKFPGLEFCVIEHVYAPDCYLTESLNERGLGYIQLLQTAYKQITEEGEHLKLDGLLIFPLSDHTNKVRFLIVFDSCSNGLLNELSIIVKEVDEVFKFVEGQLETNSESINLKMANLVSRLTHDLNSFIALIPENSAKDKALNTRIKYSEALSRDIMYYLRELNVEKSKVPIENLVSGIASGISIPGNVNLDIEYIDNVTYLTADVELIDRALSAILNNAVFVTSIEGGNINVQVKSRINISPFIDFDWLEINITDTGPGIAKEFLEKVKNPFFTTRKDQGHIGLGLSIADKIIQAHDGYLEIKSDPDEGTAVAIFLPLS
jgi:signal transduction histidine kinase